jgi:hypothetical protein
VVWSALSLLFLVLTDDAWIVRATAQSGVGMRRLRWRFLKSV